LGHGSRPGRAAASRIPRTQSCERSCTQRFYDMGARRGIGWLVALGPSGR